MSLTFAIAFYLVGMGEYLSEFLPIAPIVGAVAGGILLTALNVIDARVAWLDTIASKKFELLLKERPIEYLPAQ